MGYAPERSSMYPNMNSNIAESQLYPGQNPQSPYPYQDQGPDLKSQIQ